MSETPHRATSLCAGAESTLTLTLTHTQPETIMVRFNCLLIGIVTKVTIQFFFLFLHFCLVYSPFRFVFPIFSKFGIRNRHTHKRAEPMWCCFFQIEIKLFWNKMAIHNDDVRQLKTEMKESEATKSTKNTTFQRIIIFVKWHMPHHRSPRRVWAK